MKILLSPAKKMDFQSSLPEKLEKILHSTKTTGSAKKNNPLKKEREELLKWIPKDKTSLKKLMSLSDGLAALNAERYADWTSAKKCPAIFAFQGDVYKGLDAASLSAPALAKLQESVLILSGLYGVLRPFDEIKPHRLEMGTKLKTPLGKNLYDFWQEKIANQIIGQLADKEVIVNLASKEYFASVEKELCKRGLPIVTPIFLDRVKNSKNKYATVGLFAKKARGMMTRFIVEKKINTPKALEGFDVEGYAFSKWKDEQPSNKQGKEQNRNERFIVFQRD